MAETGNDVFECQFGGGGIKNFSKRQNGRRACPGADEGGAVESSLAWPVKVTLQKGM